MTSAVIPTCFMSLDSLAVSFFCAEPIPLTAPASNKSLLSLRLFSAHVTFCQKEHGFYIHRRIREALEQAPGKHSRSIYL